jgi:hypothetical protein
MHEYAKAGEQVNLGVAVRAGEAINHCDGSLRAPLELFHCESRGSCMALRDEILLFLEPRTVSFGGAEEPLSLGKKLSEEVTGFAEFVN